MLDAGNVELMKESGRIIWLRASPAIIKTRMLLDQDLAAFRPALTPKDRLAEIEETLAKQESLYQRAMDCAVDTDNVRLDAISDFIIENLKRLDLSKFF